MAAMTGRVANGLLWIGLVTGAFFAGRATAQGTPTPPAPVLPSSTPRAVESPAASTAIPIAVPSPLDLQGSVAPLVARVKTSVVAIHTSKTIRRVVREDPFTQYLRERMGGGSAPPEQKETQRSLGSGFLVDKEGTILTNNHVVAGADEVIVILDDERSFAAKVIGNDPSSDVAVVKLDKPPADLLPATLGDSEALAVGDYVLAIGNPLGLGQTVTMGIVSAKNRSLGTKLGEVEPLYQDFIQTDAAINQGNSGGPLFNFRGQVIGINSAILNPAVAMNVGFAIPINLARRIADQLQRSGQVLHGYLGVSTSDVEPALATKFGLDQTSGALVNFVVENSPAAQAGIKQGDVIVEVASRPIGRKNQLAQVIAQLEPGSKVKIAFLRGKQRFETEAVLQEKAAGEAVMGLKVTPLSPEESKALGLRAGQGVRVVDVEPAAFTSGELKQGDLLLAIDRTPVTVALLKRLEEVLQRGGWGRLIVQRGRQQFVLTLTG
jgi:serine protease Do